MQSKLKRHLKDEYGYVDVGFLGGLELFIALLMIIFAVTVVNLGAYGFLWFQNHKADYPVKNTLETVFDAEYKSFPEYGKYSALDKLVSEDKLTAKDIPENVTVYITNTSQDDFCAIAYSSNERSYKESKFLVDKILFSFVPQKQDYLVGSSLGFGEVKTYYVDSSGIVQKATSDNRGCTANLLTDDLKRVGHLSNTGFVS